MFLRIHKWAKGLHYVSETPKKESTTSDKRKEKKRNIKQPTNSRQLRKNEMKKEKCETEVNPR